MEFKNIHSYKDGAIGVIKINRPEIRNAIDALTISEIDIALDQWNNHEGIQVIIFTGEGDKSFISGADINQLKEKTALDGIRADFSRLCKKIEESSKISIAAINGYALGGGCELALACDIRIASANAKLGLPELNLSIIPGGGGTQRLSRVVGKGVAMDMILSGKIITAEKAESYGLVTKVVPPESLWESAIRKATTIIEKGPLATQLAKIVINEGYNVGISTGLTIEKLAQSILFSTEDKNEGVNAFLEKRSPTFEGK